MSGPEPRTEAEVQAEPRARPRLLVVDDEPSIRESLRLVLRRDFDVAVASGAAEALAAFEQDSPDAVLLDVMMPGMDGLEVCRRIRQTRQVPVIMLTARGDEGPRSAPTRPARRARGPTRRPESGRTIATGARRTVSCATHPMPPPRILVVDDDPAVRDVLRPALARGGYDALAAASGMEGLVRAQAERPDLVLLDVMMPGMDGWEVLKLLKLDAATREIPVVILSVRAEPRDRIRALQEGAVDYVAKPFAVEELLASVAAALRRAEPEGGGEGG